MLHFRWQLPAESAISPQASRLGLVIPKKNARRAVWRNAIKRQIREAFRSCPDLPSGIDVVARLAQALPGSPADRAVCLAIRQEIEQLLDQLVKRCARPVAAAAP